MINRIQTISSITCYPYFNQALERYLLDQMDQETVILFLWQNDHAWLYGADYKLEEPLSDFQASDVYPVRRLSQDEPYHQNTKDLNVALLSHCQSLSDATLEEIIRNALMAADVNLNQIEQALSSWNKKMIETSSFSVGERHCSHSRIHMAYSPELELEPLRQKLLEAYEEYFHLPPQPITGDDLNEAILNTYVKFFASEPWLELGEL